MRQKKPYIALVVKSFDSSSLNIDTANLTPEARLTVNMIASLAAQSVFSPQNPNGILMNPGSAYAYNPEIHQLHYVYLRGLATSASTQPN